MSKFRERAASLGNVLHARAGDAGVQELSVDDVIGDPEQPRKEFDAEKLASLAKSIERRGLLQPITVRSADANGKYVIRFGERRWRASRMAGNATIRAIISDTGDERGNLVDQVIENEQRDNLTTSEMVVAVQRLLAQGLSKAEIAEELACKPADVTQYVTLPQMADHLRDLIDEWPRRALYDLHVASRKFATDVERFVADRKGQGVTTAAVAGFVRDLKAREAGEAVPAPALAPAADTVAPAPAPAPVVPNASEALPVAAAPEPRANGKQKGKARSGQTNLPDAPALSVMVGGRAGRLILPATVFVLFEEGGEPVSVSLHELSFATATT